MIPGITVVIPTVAPRSNMLREALRSVADQTLVPDVIIVQKDTERVGAAANRQAGTDRVDTELVGFLDDDDTLHPQHLEHLRDLLVAENADLVFPWFEVQGGTDPLPECFGRNWQDYVNAHGPYQIPVTFLARTEAIRAAGGWAPHSDFAHASGEDWLLTLHLVEQGAKIVHLAERTWIWRHHGQNSSGLAARVQW